MKPLLLMTITFTSFNIFAMGLNLEKLKNCLAINYSAQTKYFSEHGRYSPNLYDINISPVLKNQCNDFDLDVDYNEDSFKVSAAFNGKTVGEVNNKKEIRLRIK